MLKLEMRNSMTTDVDEKNNGVIYVQFTIYHEMKALNLVLKRALLELYKAKIRVPIGGP